MGLCPYYSYVHQPITHCKYLFFFFLIEIFRVVTATGEFEAHFKSRFRFLVPLSKFFFDFVFILKCTTYLVKSILDVMGSPHGSVIRKIILFFSSVDAVLNKDMRDQPVPLWNYWIIRFQFFLLYFFAGLKKMDPDWIGGHSMVTLSTHWVFDPFR